MANIMPPSGLKLTVNSVGSSEKLCELSAKIIYLLAVCMPTFAKRMRRMMMTASETKPPVMVV